MLVVNSSFPPYNLIEVDVYAEPYTGDDGNGGLIAGVFRNQWFWANGAEKNNGVGDTPHRDGGLPAITREDGLIHYLVCGVSHRKDGLAVITGGRDKGVQGSFFLYGVRLLENEFARVHQLAGKHGVPLWMAVIAVKFEKHLGNLDELAKATVKTTEGLPNMSVEWLFKLWGLNLTHWDYNAEHVSFDTIIHYMNRVIKHELTLLKD